MDIAQFAETMRKSRRGLPKSPDGLSDAQAASRTEGKQEDEAFLLKTVKGIHGQIKRGNPLPPSALPAILDAVLHAQTQGLDDRKLLLEHLLSLMARLPAGSLQDTVQDAVIGLLYDALPHPPVNFMPSTTMEPKIPTVVSGVQMGPGGATVSDGRTGATGVVAGGKGGLTTATTPAPAPAPAFTPAPVSTSTPPTTPPAHSGLGEVGSAIRSMWSHDEPTQLPTPSTSHFGNGFPGGTSTAGASRPADSHPAARLTARQGPQTRNAYSSQFRNPSGALNNPHLPLLGAAGTAYARTVVPLHPIPATSLPDPGLVFDLLMKRTPPPPEADPTSPKYQPDSEIAAKFRGQGHGLPHPSGLSTMLFAFGDVIIHSLFRTSQADPSVNLTSSYLDLSPLYGVDEKEMQKVRRYDGTGRIWEDVWADPRIAMMPPQVGAVLVIFSRNHNFLALRLLEINERQKYTAPKFPPPKSNATRGKELFPTLDKKGVQAQDDDIFNRARLINCVFFMNVILGDYLSGILGTFRDASEWYLNPLEEIRKGGKTITQRAEGNCVSAEFNLLYRWHATLTEKDTQWLEGAFMKILPNAPSLQNKGTGPWEPTADDFRSASAAIAAKQQVDPKLWTFAELNRTPEGGFADHELAQILHEATTTMACAYGARGIPPVMKTVEVMGIKQARSWGICTINEFRKFIGLKQYESFEEWNPTPGIADAAQMLYGHIDNLELYVGLMCEESKQPGDGAGLCPGYTISRAILSDAVALTRGDRFLTTDLTPAGLTAWGYQDCARDVHNGSMGGMFSKLLFRTLPEYYPEGSIYAHFSFVTPPEMKKWLTEMRLADQYSFKPLPSDPIRPVVPINTVQGVKAVLGDVGTFRTMSSGSMKEITNDYGFFLSFNGEPRQRIGRSMMKDALHREGVMDTYSAFCRRELERLFTEKSIPLGGTQRAINIVRDVINILPIHWVCEEIAGLPLKSTEAPSGIYTEQEMYHRLTTLFEFAFLNDDPENGWQLKTKAKEYASELLPYIKGRFARARGRQSLITVQGLRDVFTHWSTGEVDNSTDFYKALLAKNSAGMTTDQLSYQVLGFVIAASTQLAQAITTVVDFYLKDEHVDHLNAIKALIKKETPEAKETLAGYVREALRLNPVISGVLRKAMADTTVEDKVVVEGEMVDSIEEKTVHILKNDRIYVSIGNANLDPTVFPNPHTVNPKREKAKYYYGQYEYTFFDEIFTEHMIPEALRVIFSKKNIKRGPNSMGQIRTFTNEVYKTKTREYLTVNGNITPFASSLFLTYDVDETPAPASTK